MSLASSSLRSVMSSNVLRRISPRARGAVARQPAAAACAASTAARPSSTVAEATWAMGRPFAGSSTSKRPPSLAPVSRPPIHRPVGTERLAESSLS